MVFPPGQSFRSKDGKINLAHFVSQLSERYGEKEAPPIVGAMTSLQAQIQQGDVKAQAISQGVFASGIEMASVLFHLSAAPDSVIAALLYPFFEKKILTAKESTALCSPGVLAIVEGALKLKNMGALPHIQDSEFSPEQADRFRKMLLIMINDVRVVLVGLAEKLSLLRSKTLLNKAEKKKVAQEVTEIYAPLANRLGIGQLQWEMEDRAFFCLNPEAYRSIKQNLGQTRVEREAYLKEVLAEFSELLKRSGVSGEISGRVKHIYSIWRKMRGKNLPFEALFDLLALRILVDDVSQCYRVLSVVHQHFSPLGHEFSDYIAMPKHNGYRSIHTVISDTNGLSVEVQIRTREMQKASEMGVASHWRYKEGSPHDLDDESRLIWMRGLLDWQRELSKDLPLSNQGQAHLVAKRVYVFTPEGRVIDLPFGATSIDFAYQVHTDLGHRCRGAKVNGRMVPLDTPLQTGEQIEILPGKESKPSRDWLRPERCCVKTARARQKIQARLRELDRKVLPREEEETSLTKPKQPLLAPQTLGAQGLESTPLENTQLFSGKGLVIGGVENVLFHLAGCCQPIRGDAVIGYITQGRGVSVHRRDCVNVFHMKNPAKERLISVAWGDFSRGGGRFFVGIRLWLEGVDIASLNNVSQLFSKLKIPLLKLNSQVDFRWQGLSVQLKTEVTDQAQLDDLLKKLKMLRGVRLADREASF